MGGMRVLPALALLVLAACQPRPPSTSSAAPPARAASPLGGVVADSARLSVEHDVGDWAQVVVSVHSDLPVQAFKGEVSVSDVLGDHLQTVQIVSTETLPAGGSAVAKGRAMLNRFNAKHMRLKSTPTDKLQFTWHTIAVVYADGTRWDARD